MYGNTIVTHGLPTPNSFPVLDEGFLDCPSMPLEHMNSQNINTFSNDLQQADLYVDGPENNPFLFTSGMTNMFANESLGPSTAPWPYYPASPHNIQTAPVSPDFLPLPDMGGTFDITYINEVPDKDELVGMGLYDSPVDVQSNCLLFGGSIPMRRKSLKLEESFEPGPLSDEEENVEEPEEEDGSFVSAEREVETAATMPPGHMSTHMPDINHEVGVGGSLPFVMPVDGFSTYSAVPLSMNQQVPAWY